jgi:radical SAM protein with 4Fe4S-binding SPASM domain
MRLKDVRRRLPVVDSLPAPDTREVVNPRPGALPTPRYAIWELTLACDQKCIHCGSRAGSARPGELSTEECLDLVTQLREMGVGEVTLIGGEAYLRDDFILVIRAIREAGMRCSMTTGGRNLNAERVAAIKDAGINLVSVSVDGLSAAHDRLRGIEGSWARAFEALRRLREAGITIGANTQINRLTLPDLPRLFEQLDDAGIRGWQLQITAAFGNAADHPEILLQPYMMREVFDTLERIVPNCEARGITVFPANNLGYFGPLEHRLRRVQNSAGHYTGCIMGKHQIGIEADGAIKGCPSVGGQHNAAGNIRTQTLAELWRSSRALAYTRERTTAELWGYCAECYYADTCRAGCTATAEPLMGRPGNNPFCHHRALEMHRNGLRERIELVERAPGKPFDHGYYRIVREPIDPAKRREPGATRTDEPRVPRSVEFMGPGRPLPR